MSTKGIAPLGPYRATKLWNDVLRTFKTGLPTGRHRRYMKSYDECFVASDAITWLHLYLRSNPSFGPTVTRVQTIQLLEKFYKAGVFEDVRGPKQVKGDFSDNGKLYRFTQTSPVKTNPTTTNRPPLVPRNGPLAGNNINTVNNNNIPPSLSALLKRKGSLDKPTCRTAREVLRNTPQRASSPVVMAGRGDCTIANNMVGARTPVTCMPSMEKPDVNNQDVEGLWLLETLSSLRKILRLDSLEDIVDIRHIMAPSIIHNLTMVNKNGLVTNIDKNEQLPQWVLSAMRCLAYWPVKVEDNLPDYPGFEKDVFKVVKEYFESLDEPLATFDLYDLFVNVMGHLENVQRHKNSFVSTSTNSDHSSHNLMSYASMENLMANMTMNARMIADRDLQPSEIMIVHDPDVDGPERPERPKSAPGYNLRRATSSASMLGARVETSFGTDGAEPHTKVYDFPGLKQGKPTEVYGELGMRRSSIKGNRSSGTDTIRTSHRSQSVSTDNVHRTQSVSVFPQSQPIPGGSTRDRCLSHNELYFTNSNKTPVQTRPQQASTPTPGRMYDPNKYGYTVVLSSMEVDAPASSVEQPAVQEHSGERLWRGSCGSLGSNASSKRSEPPPPYVSPPSYDSVCSAHKRSVLSSASSASYHTALSSSHLADDDLVPDLPDTAAGTQQLLKSKSKTSLTESYRMAIEGSSNAVITPKGKSLYGTLRRADSSPSLIMPTSRDRVLDAMQVCCLMLPPPSRRKLHFLLRLMSKMSSNEQLVMDSTVPTRDLVLLTFTRCILRPRDPTDYDDFLSNRVVSFLMDNHAAVMKAPDMLRQRIETRIASYKNKEKVVSSTPCASSMHLKNNGDFTPSSSSGVAGVDLLADCPLSYCEQVTRLEYENQKLSASQQALTELLDNLVANQQMPPKDKKRRLKQLFGKKKKTSSSSTPNKYRHPWYQTM